MITFILLQIQSMDKLIVYLVYNIFGNLDEIKWLTSNGIIRL